MKIVTNKNSTTKNAFYNSNAQNPPPQKVMENCLGILPLKSPFYVFGEARKCIYCGATEYTRGSSHPLGKEHIIPEGLGGTIILPLASCQECEKHTARTEQLILRNHLWAPRHKLGLRMKKRQRDSDLFPFTATVEGKDVVFDLPLNRHPTMLFLCAFSPPGILIDRPIGFSGMQGIWLHPMNDLTLTGKNDVNSPAFDTITFCQLLAKIAHGYAIAMIGDDIFYPALTSFICRKFAKDEAWPECYYWCGGEGLPMSPSSNLHELAIGVAEKSGKQHVMVHIRLFANLGAPTYSVVVGQIREGITREEIQARLKGPIIFPSHSPERTPAQA